MRGRCPRCRAPLKRDRFIGNGYFCDCGWCFSGIRPPSSNIPEYIIALSIVACMSFVGYQKVYKKNTAPIGQIIMQIAYNK